MDLYTLNSGFVKENIIDEFISAIWTERYGTAGDINLVVHANAETIERFAEGTFIARSGSKEVMMIESQNIESGKLIVTGPSLLQFLQNRIVRTTLDHGVRYWLLSDIKAGEVMTTIVQEMCIGGTYLTGVPPDGTAGNPDEIRAIIPNLTIGDTDTSYGDLDVAIPFGQVYDALKTIAETYHLGMSLYLDSADEFDYSLKFRSYAGRNLTSNQTTYPVVRLSSAMDSLTDIKELQSMAPYKNVAYAFAPSYPESVVHGIAYANPEASASLGFDRRVLLVFADDISTDEVGGSLPLVQAILNQRARDALAENNRVRVVDGTIVPTSEFHFGEEYKLGDIIELQGKSDVVQLARITEHIQAQDATGEWSYPTVSLITEDERDGWFGETD